MVLRSDLTKTFSSCFQTFSNKNSFLALVSICIRFSVRLSVMLTPVSFNFFLFLNYLFLMVYLASLMMIGLDCFPFSILPTRWLRSVSFSWKSSFKISVTTVSGSSFSLSFTPYHKIQILREYCSFLLITLYKSSFFYPSFLPFFPFHWCSPLSSSYLTLILKNFLKSLAGIHF